MPVITDPEIMKWTSRPPVKNETEGLQWLSARCLGKDVFNFAIYLEATNAASPNIGSTIEATSPGLPLVGLLGSFLPPAVGYMINPTFTGQGYATEALQAFIAAYFERFPEQDVLEGYTDSLNHASHRVLLKCGFTQCETVIGDFDNWAMGVRDTIAFRMARPGKSLMELGFGKEEEPPEPPVQ